MTSLRVPCLILSALVHSSCDGLKEVADKMSTTIGDKLGGSHENLLAKSYDNPLLNLVDQTDEGYVFRKDLPFPSEVIVTTVAKRRINGRLFYESQLSRKVEAIIGKEEITAEFERKGSTVLFTIKDSSFSIPTPSTDGGETGSRSVDNPFSQAPPPKKTMTFVRQNGAWKGRGAREIKLMAMNLQLSPVFGDLLIDNALTPRGIWFSSSRMKIGDEIEVTKTAMPMIVSGKTSGSLNMKLDAVEEIEGHPCGRFSVTGKYRRNGFPNLEGNLINEEVTIESGEIWLSLIYPIILKEKLKTIQTFGPADGGSVVGRAQGSVDTLVVRKWKSLEPLPEPEEPTFRSTGASES